MQDFGIWAVLISLLLNIIISIFGFIPTIFLSGANAIVFGFIPGFLISLMGEVVGAAISYWLYQWGWSKTRVHQKKWLWLQKLEHERRGKQFTVLLIARLTPLIPSGMTTLIAAISNMRFGDFLVATLIGKIPSIAMETLVGHDLITINQNWPRLLISLFSLLILLLLFKKKKEAI